jgi:glycosyltransferase involved in cell wall biosynthesis
MPVVLYDGWPLVHNPNSAHALHLLTLLSYRPADFQIAMALPGEPTGRWADGIQTLIERAPDTGRGRLEWQQRLLPRLAKKARADIIHLTTPNPPLFGGAVAAISPVGYGAEVASAGSAPPGLRERLRQAMAVGGLEHVRAVFWPTDLPQGLLKASIGPIFPLPPVVHPGFYRQDYSWLKVAELPEEYVLYHGPYDERTLIRALRAWQWTAAPIGFNYPLVLMGMDELAKGKLHQMLPESEPGETLRVLPSLDPADVPGIYRQSKAVFHPARSSAWEGPVRQALVSGVPLVAAVDPLTEAIVGDAAYLSKADDDRTLGAALITVIVEDGVAQQLIQAGLKRTAGWDALKFKQRLEEAYQTLLKGK